MAVVVEVVRLAPQPVASTIVPGIPPSAVGAALHGALPDVFSHLEAHGVAMVGAPFARFHGRDDGTLDVEIGIPVGGAVPETDAIRARLLPGGDAATAVHVGSYDALAAVVDAVTAWPAQHGRAAGGGHWESYIDDPSQVAVEQLRTQVVLPLAPA